MHDEFSYIPWKLAIDFNILVFITDVIEDEVEEENLTNLMRAVKNGNYSQVEELIQNPGI